MPRVTCRCGHKLKVPSDGPDRVVCPECSAKIRVRRAEPGASAGDGFVRFACPCGRRLKVKAPSGAAPVSGKCPDCGRIVPVPGSSSNPAVPTSHPEAQTEEMSPEEIAMLDQWAQDRLTQQATGAPVATGAVKIEAGLRVCPRCKRPVHMGAVVCRECGTHVPKR